MHHPHHLAARRRHRRLVSPRWAHATLTALTLLTAPATHALEIVFDDRFDRSGFSDAGTAEGAARRAVLEQAAQAYAGFTDTLSAISPQGTDSWQLSFQHPSWTSFFEQATVRDLAVPADTLVVFIGASPFAGSVLGIASGGTVTASGSTQFLDTVAARGQAGALAEVPTDVGPWGGSIWFNSSIAWHTGVDTGGLGFGQSDLLTTVTHELGHLLGFGQAASWQALAGLDAQGQRVFMGAGAMAEHGGPVPLDSSASHWAAGVGAHLMDPSTPRGVREPLTALDLAAFGDIGWQVSAVPEPGALGLAGAGLLAVAIARRRPRSARRGPGATARAWCMAGLLGLAAGAARADHYPVFSSWPQAGGPGTPITLTYSYSNLFNGSLVDRNTGQPFEATLLRSAFEAALRDYAAVLPISFLEVADTGPLPETGPYDATGLADIRIGIVPTVRGAYAYAYFPSADPAQGLGGDIVFNAASPWTPVFFYGVAQHELSHVLGAGHAVEGDPPAGLPGTPAAQQAGYEGPVFGLSLEMAQALQAVYGVGSGTVTPLSAVPEPSGWGLMAAGLALVGWRQRRRCPSATADA